MNNGDQCLDCRYANEWKWYSCNCPACDIKGWIDAEDTRLELYIDSK